LVARGAWELPLGAGRQIALGQACSWTQLFVCCCVLAARYIPVDAQTTRRRRATCWRSSRRRRSPMLMVTSKRPAPGRRTRRSAPRDLELLILLHQSGRRGRNARASDIGALTRSMPRGLRPAAAKPRGRPPRVARIATAALRNRPDRISGRAALGCPHQEFWDCRGRARSITSLSPPIATSSARRAAADKLPCRTTRVKALDAVELCPSMSTKTETQMPDSRLSTAL